MENTHHPTIQILNPKTGNLKITCGHCGSKQTVEPAVTGPDGWIYGSAADFCDNCDKGFQEVQAEEDQR